MKARAGDEYAMHLTRVLARLDLATRHPLYTCKTCGCRCLHGESCPACKVTAARQEVAV